MRGTTEKAERNQSSSTLFPKGEEPVLVLSHPTSSSTITDEPQHHQPIPSTKTSFSYPPSDEDTKKWGTHIMGTPAAPTVHPDNQKAALWTAADHQQIYHQPYVVYSPVEKQSHNTLEPVINMFNNWTRKAETVACNIWHHLKTGHSVSEAAWGKVTLTAKAITEGGFESLFKQTFETLPNEKLKKTFACYLSTSTGPVAGTLYLSTVRVAFCSDRPLTFIAPSGQEAWSYYKVTIPLENISTVNPVITRENPPEKYIQLVTVDGHEFWFMGFINFEKALNHLLNSVSEVRAAQAVVG
ncbi:GEM-like protein 5 [Juglans microcarpa x Juglans regia]|uniref:GEM-like protein 5 n=1 Tax=Juglans microcarpa x Juglans regia TaxID=2249226 RepID=UPI001B7E5840|nr:GEM-like protein 5 [Juglans microcarpa x Juglans regia]